MSLRGPVHIIGAGLAGLAAAVALAERGRPSILYEAAPRAGGRCRSYHDPVLDRLIDNGNHFVMSGNRAVMRYLDIIGARDRLTGPEDSIFPFYDIANGARWQIRLSKGRIPWWVLNPRCRAPGSHLHDYLGGLKILQEDPFAVVAKLVGDDGPAVRGFWEPLVVAALNEPLDRGAACLLAPVLRETFLKGAEFTKLRVARTSLADTYIDPALDYITAHGGSLRMSTRVQRIDYMHGIAVALDLGDSIVPVNPGERVVVAVPAWQVGDLVPDSKAPPAGQAIVNVHYGLPEERPMAITGLVGGLAQWLLVHEGLASVTISAADTVAERLADDIAQTCWGQIAPLLDLSPATMPPFRVIKERRATFDQSPAFLRFRASTLTRFPNVQLAGDWTATGLPATIEGAIRSGFAVATGN